ncbi:MAG: CoA-disulfide reductase [Anaerolineae bacterium]|jgi:NADPH-dependent 2,4-dienoyl-CoA reductase/sulfur reductase-like enzyme|nr:CoA-disulfide reductase [Anaerolineae bacterium]MDH7472412.1 CoA-disulfide reductase [Anaerolineae bacterium]
MSGERLIVIGGVAAGMSAASKAKRVNRDLDVVVYEKSGFVSYGSCGLPYYIAGVVRDHNDLIARTPAEFARQGIAVHVHHEVTEIDPVRQMVRVVNLENNQERSEPYDQLVIATGGRPAVPRDLPGKDLPGVFVMRTVEDGIAIREWLQNQWPQRVVIAGAGYIGMECAESFLSLGLEVTIIGRPPQVLRNFDPEMARLVQEELESKRARLSLGNPLIAIEGDTRVRQVVTEQGTFEADLVLLALGVVPNSALAQATGVVTGVKGAIVTDAQMRTNLPNIYAAGDCAEAYHRVTGKGAYIPLGTTANKQGRVAGANAAGGQTTFEGVVGTAVTKVCDIHAARTGLTEKEAREMGYQVSAVQIKAPTRAHYYPGNSTLHVRLLVDTSSGKLLGSQVVGREGVARRIDVLATALHQGWTVENLARLDLAYAPPFAPVWDPLLVAANVALKD